jgi:hypothetical protein
MATWYFKNGMDRLWDNSFNWWSNADGTGSNPTSAPWLEDDGYKNDDLALATTATQSPLASMIQVGYYTTTGTCSIPGIEFYMCNVRGGVFTGDSIQFQDSTLHLNSTGNTASFSGSGVHLDSGCQVIAGIFTGSGLVMECSVSLVGIPGETCVVTGSGAVISGTTIMKGTFSGGNTDFTAADSPIYNAVISGNHNNFTGRKIIGGSFSGTKPILTDCSLQWDAQSNWSIYMDQDFFFAWFRKGFKIESVYTPSVFLPIYNTGALDVIGAGLV